MRTLLAHVDGKAFRGSWDTWEDKAWGRMVEVGRDGWQVRAPVNGRDPEHVATRCLEWCVRESMADRHR